jgi:ABC-type metal ion transport system substrate-binding protein
MAKREISVSREEDGSYEIVATTTSRDGDTVVNKHTVKKLYKLDKVADFVSKHFEGKPDA